MDFITYPKIQSVWLRDPENKHRTFLEGAWALPEFEYLAGAMWAATEKIDGTNIRVMWDGSTVKFGGRTARAQIPAPLVEHLMAQFTQERMAEVFDYSVDAIILFGEGFGKGIQKAGANYLADHVSFILFDVWISGLWLERSNVEDIARKLSIPIVTEWDYAPLTTWIEKVREGKCPSAWGDFQAEGLVLRPIVPLLDRRGNRIITKAKVKDFDGTV